MKNKIIFALMLAICLLVMPNVYAADELKTPELSVGTGEVYGKNATDLGEKIAIKNGKVTGTLKYVESYSGFSSTAKGYFLYLTVNKESGVTYKFDVKGPGAKSENTYSTLEGDDNKIVALISNNNQTIDVVAEKDGQQKHATIDLTEIKLENLSITIEIPEDETPTELGDKKASDLQSGVTFNNGFKGTLNYLEKFEEFDKDAKGYFLFFKVKEATEGKNVEVALSGDGAENPNQYVKLGTDGLFVAKVNKNTESIKVKVTGENGEYYEETYSLAKLSLGKGEESEEIVEAEANEETTTNPSTSDSLLVYVSLGVVALVTALGTGLYLRRN